MTEEIIINDVNVAGCDLYCSRGYCMDDNISPVDCKDRPDCEYKQLKRLEQENKKLKSQRDEARIAYNNLILDIASDIPFEGEIGGERNISIEDHLHQMQKALASLEEIREIADKCKECLNEDDDCGCDYLRIVRKINEVLQ